MADQDSSSVQTFDVRKSGLSKKKKETLEKIHLDFRQALETLLSGYTPVPIKIFVKDVRTCSYEQFQKSIDRAVLLSVFEIDPMNCPGLLRFDGQLALGFIDKMLGGGGNPPEKPRDLSLVEFRIADEFIRKTLSLVNGVWDKFGDCLFRPKKNASSTEDIKFLAGDDAVVIIEFECKVDTKGYVFQTCLPFDFMKPFLASWERGDNPIMGDLSDPKMVHVIKNKMEDIDIPVEACLGELELPLKEVTDIENGDVIRLGEVGKPLVIRADNVPVLLGRPGVFNKKVAVEVLQSIDNTEAPEEALVETAE